MHVLQRLFFGNYILSVALLSWLAAQICKTIINYILSGKFEAERMWGAGGMPSAHSALVCSMFMAAAKSQGVNSPIFAIAFILAAIVMYDAMGVRRETADTWRKLVTTRKTVLFINLQAVVMFGLEATTEAVTSTGIPTALRLTTYRGGAMQTKAMTTSI